MRGGIWRTAFAVVGAVIGAGFASGRELDTFFAAFGRWGLLGAVCAAAALVWLLRDGYGRQQGLLWRLLFGAMTAVTGAAMLACAGELTALALPVHGAYGIGMGGALVFAAVFRRRRNMLTGLGGVLSAMLAAMLVSGLFIPPEGAAVTQRASAWRAASYGLCYGGMNAALALPALAGSGLPERERRRSVLAAGGMLLVLLGLGWAVLLRLPQLRGEAVPLVRLMARYGRAGYALCLLTMGAAVLSTLLCCAAGLEQVLPRRAARWWPLFPTVLALWGFRKLVAQAYPVLGAACFALLAADSLAPKDAKTGRFSRIGRK